MRDRNAEAVREWNYAHDFLAFVSGDKGTTGYFRTEDIRTIRSYVDAVVGRRNFDGWQLQTMGQSTLRGPRSSTDHGLLMDHVASESVPGSFRGLVDDEVMMLKVKYQQSIDYSAVRVFTMTNPGNGRSGYVPVNSTLIGMSAGSGNYFNESASVAALLAHEAFHVMGNSLGIRSRGRDTSDTLAKYSYHLTNSVPMARGSLGLRQYSGVLRLNSEQGAAAMLEYYYLMKGGGDSPLRFGTFGQATGRMGRHSSNCQCSTPFEILGASCRCCHHALSDAMNLPRSGCACRTQTDVGRLFALLRIEW